MEDGECDEGCAGGVRPRHEAVPAPPGRDPQARLTVHHPGSGRDAPLHLQ